MRNNVNKKASGLIFKEKVKNLFTTLPIYPQMSLVKISKNSYLKPLN